MANRATRSGHSGTQRVRAATSVDPARADGDALVAMFNQGRFVEGESLARALTSTYPKSGFVWKVLGAMLTSLGRSEEALEAMQRAAALLPRDEQLQSNLGVVLAALQRHAEAEACHRRAIKLQPAFAQAYFNLGTVLQAQERWAEAEDSYRQAVKLKPDFAAAHKNLANVLLSQGKLSEAEQSYRRSLTHAPDEALVHYVLGNVLKDLHRTQEAEDSYRNALRLDPGATDVHINLGIVLKRQGKTDAAEASYRQALQIDTKLASAHYNLGILLAERDQPSDAECCYRRAIELKPDYAEAHNNLGNLLEAQRRYAEAEASLRRAVAINPAYADAYSNLGNALRKLRKLPEAEANYRRAIAINADLAPAWYNLGIAIAEQHRFAEAEKCYERALELKPNYPDAQKNLANTYKEQGRYAEAEAGYRKAVALKPDFVDAQSNLLFDLNYTDEHSVAERLEEARRFGRMVRVADRYTNWLADPRPQRLSVGFVSADLRNHPVGFFIESLLQNLDRSRVEVLAYSAHDEEDELTARIRPLFSKWTSLVGATDAKAATLIRDDGVHVLIDLSGHTARNRLPLFAYKPAPVQVTWLGYFATTGVPEIDYWLGDAYVIPPQEESHFTERVWRLPESYLCFTPPNFELQSGPLPALSRNAVTFGCFNSLPKITDAVVALWSRVLHAVPSATLLLKTVQLGYPKMSEAIHRRFAVHGIGPERVVLEAGAPRPEFMAAYRRVDIALDPFPYTGGTTTAEALWMGVPIVTRRGNRFLSHMGESIASNVGLGEWIAAADDDYVAKAVHAAADLPRLANLRSNLRNRMLASPLCDAPRFANHFTAALWGMWNRRRTESEEAA